MAKLSWDQTGERRYETGVDNGVLYVQDSGSYGDGVAWNGISNVTESPSGAEASAIYADNIKYLNLYSAEEFGCTIEAYTYPDEWMACDGSANLSDGVAIGQQERKGFGFSYRSRIGNDVDGDAHGYKYHLIYGCRASTSQRAYGTVSDSPEAIQFSWEVTTTPITVEGFRPTSIVTIDSTKVDPTELANFLKVLYGSDDTYTKLTTQPADWTTNYTDYYTRNASTGEYEAVTGAEAPTFAADTYYSKTAGTTARLPLPDEMTDFFSAG